MSEVPMVVCDPSLEHMPQVLVQAYGKANANIAAEHIADSAHILSSQQGILRTARFALTRTPSSEPRHAVILGAGNCYDIPLAEILDDFDKTTLVDVDTKATEEALSGLSSKELRKVSLVGADITGIMAEFGYKLHEMDENAIDIRKFITAATQAVKTIDPLRRQPNLGENFSFVCSQLLLTQLGSVPFLSLSNQLRARYGTPLSLQPGRADEALVVAIGELNLGVQLDHIRYLAQLVSKSGAVHFADTYTEVFATPSGDKALPMVFDELIKPVIDSHFSEISPRQAWWWDQINGRRFGVISHSLQPAS